MSFKETELITQINKPYNKYEKLDEVEKELLILDEQLEKINSDIKELHLFHSLVVNKQLRLIGIKNFLTTKKPPKE